jgi:hypothetical protein
MGSKEEKIKHQKNTIEVKSDKLAVGMFIMLHELAGLCYLKIKELHYSIVMIHCSVKVKSIN